MMTTYHVMDRIAMGQRTWDEFVDASDDAWLWHRYDLQDALATWPGRIDASFAITDVRNRILAVMPLHIISWTQKKILRRTRMESLGGLACINGLTDRQQAKLLKSVLNHVASLAVNGCQGLLVSLSPMAPRLRSECCPRVNPLVLHGFKNMLTQTWVLDIQASVSDLWQGMEGRARTAVRKAEKLGVSVRMAGEDDLDTYYALHEDTYRRTGVCPHPKDYFRTIWDKFLPNGLARIWIAERDGEAIAAENFGIYKNATIYWTGASNSKGLEAQANTLLQWTGIQWMVQNGVKWYEIGEAFPGVPHGKTKGLNDFKKSFGGVLYPYFKGWREIAAIKAATI